MSIYFLWGDEDFLIEKEVQKIKKEILKDDVNELNFRTVDNPSFSLFSEILRTNSMMFGDIVVQIKCPKYFLETKNKEKLDEKQTKELIDAINSISSNVHIILICPTPRGEKKKPDSRKKLYKELIKVASVQEFPSYRNYEEYKLIPIIKKMANEISIKIDDKCASKLIQSVGSSLRDINAQLEKIKLTIYPENIVSEKIIDDIVPNNADIFALVDLILKKDYVNSLSLISEILQKEHFLPSLAFLQTSISNLLKIKIFSKKYSSFDIATKINQNEFIVRKNIEKLSSVDVQELIRLKINLAEMEFLLKTGGIKDAMLGYEMAFIEREIKC